MIDKYLHFSLNITAPAVFPTAAGDPNSAVSLPWIPGSALRGAIAGKLGEDHPDFTRVILSGDVRFLNAYPSPGRKRRPIPVPLFLRKKKNDNGSRLDLFDQFGPGEGPLERIPGKFLYREGSSLYLWDAKRGCRLHTQVDRASGKAWTGPDGKPHGTIFVYEYLEAPQAFEGVFHVRGSDESYLDHLTSILREAVEPGLSLGRSRNASYGGHVEFACDWSPGKQESEQEYDSWDTLTSKDEITVGERFLLIMTSPYIGRDPLTGQIDPTCLPKEILSRFPEGCLAIGQIAWEFDTFGGFNRKWGMEIPQALSARAGTTVELEAAASFPTAHLKYLLNEGLGERLGEGFGRLVLVKRDFFDGRALESKPRAATESSPRVLDTIETQRLSMMQERLLEKRLASFVERLSDNWVEGVKGTIPSRALLGRLRLALKEPEAGAALQKLETLVKGLPPASAKKLDRCILGNDPLKNDPFKNDSLKTRLLELIKLKGVKLEDDTFEHKIPMARLLKESRFLDKVEESVFEKLWDKTRVALIDRMLSRLVVQSRNKGSEKDDRQ